MGGASLDPRLMLPRLSDQQEENLMTNTENRSTQESANAELLPDGLLLHFDFQGQEGP